MLLRGIKTLALRIERQNSNALKIAEFLAAHPAVENIYYPSLRDHAGRDAHAKQASGGGSVISFTTGDADLSRRIAEATRIFSIAVSFGSVNSSISLPCRMSHASIPQALRDRLAPPADLVRISVGIEDVYDLLEDLDTAISTAVKAESSPDASIAIKRVATVAFSG